MYKKLINLFKKKSGIKNRDGYKYYIQENKKISDYINKGTKVQIIEYSQPSFIWNRDELKILHYPDTMDINGKIKSGNILKFVKYVSDITTSEIDQINDSYGIVIIPRHEVALTHKNNKSGLKYNQFDGYRFVILEGDKQFERDKKINKILKW